MIIGESQTGNIPQLRRNYQCYCSKKKKEPHYRIVRTSIFIPLPCSTSFSTMDIPFIDCITDHLLN